MTSTIITPRSVATGKFPSAVPVLLKFAQAFASRFEQQPVLPGRGIDRGRHRRGDHGPHRGRDHREDARVQGAVAARGITRTNLKTALHAAKSYVQLEGDANPARAQAIIESSSLTVRKTVARQKFAFCRQAGHRVRHGHPDREGHLVPGRVRMGLERGR